MKTIPLTQGKVALVDDEDYAALSVFKWCAVKRPKSATWYAQRNERTNGKHTTIVMHRQIMRVANRGTEVDHKNRDGLDNQKSNLRLCTGLQNKANRVRFNVAKTSRFHGVSWDMRRKKWHAQIQQDGKKASILYSIDEEEAARSYDVAAAEMFGEFAVLNFATKGTV